MAPYQFDVILWNDGFIHGPRACKIWKSIGYMVNEIQTKENAFLWTLTVIYTSKMAPYEVGVILWNDWLVIA